VKSERTTTEEHAAGVLPPAGLSPSHTCCQGGADAACVCDPVNKPSHYNKGGIECIDAIASAIKGYDGIEAHLTGCCIKYLWRWKSKNGIQDLLKCEAYLKRLIAIAQHESAKSVGVDYEVIHGY